MTATRHGPIPRFATGKVRAIEPSDFRVLGEIPSQALSFTIYRARDRARDQRPVHRRRDWPHERSSTISAVL
jgi:hypothetical protein